MRPRGEDLRRALHEEAATHCHGVRDYVSRGLFEKPMRDEEEHIDFLETPPRIVAKLGAELHSQHWQARWEQRLIFHAISLKPIAAGLKALLCRFVNKHG